MCGSFLLDGTVKKIGVDIGVWEDRNGTTASLLSTDLAKQGEDCG